MLAAIVGIDVIADVPGVLFQVLGVPDAQVDDPHRDERAGAAHLEAVHGRKAPQWVGLAALDQHQLQGILPVWTVNHENQYVKSRPDYQALKDMLAQPVPPNYFHPKSNELATAFGEAIVGVLYGKGQPKPLLDDAAAKMDRILKD